ncbi:MAG: hypothetical protein NTNFB02_12650 [Nitrospira sp.]
MVATILVRQSVVLAGQLAVGLHAYGRICRQHDLVQRALFWISILFVFWLASLGAKKEPVKETSPVPAHLPQPIAVLHPTGPA